MSHESPTPAELARQIAALQQQLQALEAQAQEATRYAAVTDQGTAVQGEGNVTATQGSIAIGRDAQIVIRGDNNSINAILQQTAPLDEAGLRREMGRYLTWLRDRTGTIELRGIKREGQQVVQLALETVYVPLAARVFFPEQEVKGRGARRAQAPPEQTIDLNEVLALGRRLVITGGPGCGKTTVLLHLAYALTLALAADDPALALARLGLSAPLPLPLFVPLSAYAAYRRELPRRAPARERTLAAFISRHLIEKQSSFDLPADFFAQLLRQGQSVLLLLDGLDEVPNEAERAAVRESIEDLVDGRPELRVVVTCRSAAYQERTALGKGFREVRVQPLDTGHITALVRQAYAAIYPHDPARQAAKAQELLDGLAHLEAERARRLGKEAPRLIDSPLLVRMLLVVHFSERRLPEQRAELYMKATDAMLLPDYGPDEEVADEIGRLVGGSRERHRDLVQHLAYHLHGQGPEQGREVTEPALRDILAREPAYAELADDFIALTRLRGTLLEERLGLYRFLHLGFQEFLAARYLAEVVSREEGLAGVVQRLAAGPLLDSWWREPVLLLVGYLSSTSPQAATRLLRQLAGTTPPAHPAAGLPPETAWAAAELAGSAAHEWDAVAGEVGQEVAQHLAGLLADPAQVGQVRPVLRAAAGAALGKLGDPRRALVEVAAMQFCYVPAGTFWMGEGQEMHWQECLDYDYWLARFPVSYGQFAQFMAAGGYANPAYWPEAAAHGQWVEGRMKGYFYEDRDNRPGEPGVPNQPVRAITWYEALAFARWLDEQWRGRLPAGLHVTLPTEAEWEKGARGGLQVVAHPVYWAPGEEAGPAGGGATGVDNPLPQRVYPWGDTADAGLANCQESGIGDICSLGCFPAGAGPYGAADLAGNVWEWTRTLRAAYPYEPDKQRENLAAGRSQRRVLRGGAYYNNRTDVRCAARYGYNPSLDLWYLGFRLVLSPFDSGH